MSPRSRSGSVMRLRGRMLATPVRWYRHGETGATLVLILNNHVGAAGYFRVMRQRVAALEDRGAVVYAEGIRPAPPADWLMASPAEQQARDVLRALYHDRAVALAAGLGWVFQGDALAVDGWTSPDMTDLELVRLAGPAAIAELGAAAAAADAQLGRHADRYLRAVAPVVYRRLARPHGWLSRLVTRLAPDLYAVLREHRSELAAAAVDTKRDAVVIYGAEHADSLEAALATTGWAFTGRCRWLTVGQLPPLWRTAAAVLAVSWAVGRDLAAASQAAGLGWAYGPRCAARPPGRRGDGERRAPAGAAARLHGLLRLGVAGLPRAAGGGPVRRDLAGHHAGVPALARRVQPRRRAARGGADG